MYLYIYSSMSSPIKDQDLVPEHMDKSVAKEKSSSEGYETPSDPFPTTSIDRAALRLLKLLFLLYIHPHLFKLHMLLLILFLTHRLRHKHHHSGLHHLLLPILLVTHCLRHHQGIHLLHSHQTIHGHQRNLNFLYQNWCPRIRKRRVKLLLLAQLGF